MVSEKRPDRKYKYPKFATNILILFCEFLWGFLCVRVFVFVCLLFVCCCCIILILMTHLLVNNENCLFYFEKSARGTIIENFRIHVFEMLLCTFFFNIFSFIFLITILAYSLQSNLTLLVLVVLKIKNASLIMSDYCIKETLLFKWGSAV